MMTDRWHFMVSLAISSKICLEQQSNVQCLIDNATTTTNSGQTRNLGGILSISGIYSAKICQRQAQDFAVSVKSTQYPGRKRDSGGQLYEKEI